jgi:hypothetical protein
MNRTAVANGPLITRLLVAGLFFLVVMILMAPLGTVAAHRHFDDDDYVRDRDGDLKCAFSGVAATCPGGWSSVMSTVRDAANRNSPRFVELVFRAGEEAVINMAKQCRGGLDAVVQTCYSAEALATIGIRDPGLGSMMQRCGIRTLRELMCFLRACGTFAAM